MFRRASTPAALRERTALVPSPHIRPRRTPGDGPQRPRPAKPSRGHAPQPGHQPAQPCAAAHPDRPRPQVAGLRPCLSIPFCVAETTNEHAFQWCPVTVDCDARYTGAGPGRLHLNACVCGRIEHRRACPVTIVCARETSAKLPRGRVGKSVWSKD